MSLALSSRRAVLAPGPWVRNELWRRARAVPSLDLRFAENKSLRDAVTGQSLITFTRASSATYVDSAGVIRTATTDEARFDHSTTNGESLGLLVEELRVNRLLYNRTLTNAAWVATGITAAKDQTGADGVSSGASSITATAGNGTILQTITSASAARATSAYVKRITGTGTIQMTQDNGSTWTSVTVTSGWTRVTIPSATVTNPVVGFRIVTSGDAIAVDYVQCEDGAFSTSAISETTTATVTRSADVASISGAAFSGWYRQDEFTAYVDARLLSNTSATSKHLFMVSDGTGDNRIAIFGPASGGLSTFRQTGAGANQTILLASVTPNVSIKTACAFTASDSAGSVNGGTSIAIGNVAMPVGVDRFGLWRTYGTTDPSNAHIARVTFWPRRLGNEVLQSITR